MKKIILLLAMVMTAIGANAQDTYNVRAGVAYLNEYAAFTTMAQANISLKNVSLWTFSPAVQFATDGYNIAGILHANMGYRIRIGDNCLFVPKMGIAVGYFSQEEYNQASLVGPSIDLAFELKRFVIGLTGFYSINQAEEYYEHEFYNIPMLSLTLGYTF